MSFQLENDLMGAAIVLTLMLIGFIIGLMVAEYRDSKELREAERWLEGGKQ